MGLERGVKKKLCKKLIKCFTLVLIAVNQFTYSCALPLVEPEGRDTSQSECLKSPETILIECRLVNVKDAVCIDKNVISIPSTPENDKEGEVNCTATQPIDMSFVGYQLDDFVNTSFVRNADNVFNEATYVFSVAFRVADLKASREVIVTRLNNPDQKMTFFLFRPGKSIFSSNLTPKSSNQNSLNSVEFTEKDVIIPCISNDPGVVPTLEAGSPASDSQLQLIQTSTFSNTKGFILNTVIEQATVNPAGRYICKAKRANSYEEEKVTFEVQPSKGAIFEPEMDNVYLFSKSQLMISCKFGERVILEGKFKGTAISPRPIVSDISLLPYESQYVDRHLKVGDAGQIHCKSLSDGRILKTWTITTLDIANNPILEMKTHPDKLQVICQSSTIPVDQMKLDVVFCQGETECELNEFCFHEKHASKNTSCIKSVPAQQCRPHDVRLTGNAPNGINALCLTLTSNMSQGMVRCSAGNQSYQTSYFIGFDKKLYMDWEEAPLSALIEISVPNITMYPQNSYPFGCKAAKFISDGRLQWVIRGKDGSEILLHKNRVQDLRNAYATNLDYQLYTVRESNIKLIYPNDYDIICMVPMWNATAWVRHHKRINVAAKEAPVVEIVSASVAVIVILLIVVVYVMWRLKKAKDAIRNLTEKEVEEFLEGNPEALKNAADKDAHEVIDALPYDQKFEIPRGKLLIDSENMLGKGAFGTVLKGRVEGIKDFVAVKTVNSSCEVNQFKGFLSELKIMIFIGKHPNIVSLIGASTEKIKEKTLYIIVEYCANGSLESYLRKHKHSIVNQIVNDQIQPDVSNYENTVASTSTESSVPEGTITTVELVRFSYQIGIGMEYLASKKVVHADLASRNCLVDYNGNVKITDFGLSRQLFDYTQYVKKQQEPLPWRWMAIESLQQLCFSTQSDVWAYGILLWEIFSAGDIPYPGLNWDIHFVEQLCDGLRLIKPQYSTSGIYNLMLDCWQEVPDSRPKFTFLAQYFKSLLEVLNVELELTKESQPDESGYCNANILIPGYLRVGDLSDPDKSSRNIYVNS